MTGGAACYFYCSSATATTLGITVGGTVGPAATNARLQNFISMLFQESDKLPSGTAGAVRYELATGEPVGGFFHSEKAQQIINGLNNLLKSETLSLHDQQLAKSLILDLQNALAGR